ncbi:gluconokinase [Undibacterium sp. Ji67W]|uniref:gluconokinase n=1 Tax=Undibacterium sp. Ji67W TaxID=3413042 RepID=UPI003BF08FCF
MNSKQDQLESTGVNTSRWVVMGVCGCGKTEIGQGLAHRLNVQFIEGDQYHSSSNVKKMRDGIPLTDNDRSDWLLQLTVIISEAREQGRGLVLSCSALKRAYRDLLRSADPELQFIHLYGDRDIIAQRMQARQQHFMPVSLLDSQLADLQALQGDEQGISLNIEETPATLINCIVQTQSTYRGSKS